MAAGAAVESSPFLRQLTSSDIPTRREAFGTLRLYLQRSAAFDILELLKLWKGLFYCMWMTANPKPQQRLAQDFASLVTDTVQKQNVMIFVDAFWQTMAQQWGVIDYHRIDKYLKLVRLMLRATFQCLGNNGSDEGMLQKQNDIMKRIPLNVEDEKIPNGMRYHVLDIIVDELEVVRDALTDVMTPAIIEELLQPVVKIRSESDNKAVRIRATEALADERLLDFGVKMDAQATTMSEQSEDEEFDGFGD